MVGDEVYIEDVTACGNIAWQGDGYVGRSTLKLYVLLDTIINFFFFLLAEN